MTTDSAAPQRDARVLPDVSHLSIGVLGGTGEQGHVARERRRIAAKLEDPTAGANKRAP